MSIQKIKFETGSAVSRGKMNQFAYDARVIKTHVTKKGKSLLLAAVADDQAPFINNEHPSEVAISIITDIFTSKIISQIDAISDYNGMEQDIKDIFNLVNTSLYTRAQSEGVQTRTSVAMILVIDDQMLIGNIGENRIIRIREDEVIPLAGGSSWFSQATKVRGMTVREALSSSHILGSGALGVAPMVECDFQVVNLGVNDQVLIYSDGVAEFISDQEIQVIVKSVENIPGACMRLTEISLERGLKDSASVVFFKLISSEEAHKKSIEEIKEKKEEKKPGGCSIIYYIILFSLLFVIGVATYVGYRHAGKLMKNMLKAPSSPTPTTTAPGEEPAPDLPSGKTFLVLEKDSMPLNFFRLNKKKLDVAEERYEITGEHNELELMPVVSKGTYNVQLAMNAKDSFLVFEGATRNMIRIYEDNLQVHLTKGAYVKLTPQVEGGVSRLQVSGMASPISINFAKDNLIIKIDKDQE